MSFELQWLTIQWSRGKSGLKFCLSMHSIFTCPNIFTSYSEGNFLWKGVFNQLLLLLGQTLLAFSWSHVILIGNSSITRYIHIIIIIIIPFFFVNDMQILYMSCITLPHCRKQSNLSQHFLMPIWTWEMDTRWIATYSCYKKTH